MVRVDDREAEGIGGEIVEVFGQPFDGCWLGDGSAEGADVGT